MDGLLFDPTDYTDQRIRAVMEGKTCRNPMRDQTNFPIETYKPKSTFHFMTREELLQREQEIREASIDAYHQQCRESRERLKRGKRDKRAESCEWQRINSGCLELDMSLCSHEI